MAGMAAGGAGAIRAGAATAGASSVSFSFGFPFAYPYYAYPYYAYPVAAPESPPVTEVQPAAAPGPAPQQSWYFCSNPKGYYPYVQNCSSGWTSVPVTPPGVSP